ncbi:hypothetical protein Patl1_00426 [Pistacia atlantica]|uniref:Uncharacterized protein n=1 Tax=Pistacia atlantica TaxID=434234 RepID=A0ACC1C6A2_9ROSI|nr:hypothetical protein Patl1_00426 [Pistacia atlantica]
MCVTYIVSGSQCRLSSFLSDVVYTLFSSLAHISFLSYLLMKTILHVG